MFSFEMINVCSPTPLSRIGQGQVLHWILWYQVAQIVPFSDSKIQIQRLGSVPWIIDDCCTLSILRFACVFCKHLFFR